MLGILVEVLADRIAHRGLIPRLGSGLGLRGRFRETPWYGSAGHGCHLVAVYRSSHHFRNVPVPSGNPE